MDNEQPHQELVKCVLVGDTAVGKTRLICARACNKHVSLSQLLSTHVPTVWAIDQYRIYKDVLERSWEVVDSVNVSLRLWDTFGDHEKDRRFAYGRSDVILLCFSITNRVSLRNCKLMWFPEIRRFCPNTPVILVGCKNDLRFMYRDEAYLSYFGDRSPFLRAARKTDLVMPDEARAVAKELGIYYYETSVLTYFGVNEVFENAIRAALLARKQQRFWMTNLKRVQRPILQVPFRPPRPLAPEISISNGSYAKDMLNLFKMQCYTDLLIVVGDVRFPVHRFILSSNSTAFNRLFNMDFTSDMGARSSSESSMVSSTYGDSVGADFDDDTEYLIRHEQKTSLRMWEHLKRRSSYQVLPTFEQKKVSRELHHPLFQNIRIVQVDDDHSSIVQTQTIIVLTKAVTARAIAQCLMFLYTGTIEKEFLKIDLTLDKTAFLEIRDAATLLDLPQLVVLLNNIHADESFLNEDTIQHYTLNMKNNLEVHCVDKGSFSDIVFELDGGIRMRAHRAMLITRCEVMRAMLNGQFLEAHAQIIRLPGVTEYTFHKLLCYIYTDEIPNISSEKCLNLLELANRLCLPRFLNLIEVRVIEDLTRISQSEMGEAVELSLKLLESVKLHNAHQLAEWLMVHLIVNFNNIYNFCPKTLKLLHPENQEYLKENRWPPIWYLKEYDFYQRSLREQNIEKNAGKKNYRNSNEGCLCFSGGKKSRDSIMKKVSTTPENSIFRDSDNQLNRVLSIESVTDGL